MTIRMARTAPTIARSPTARPRPVGRHIFAGFAASFIGIGLARFAYTPLLPALIQAHWFSQADAVYLGAANLAGYLVGAILGRSFAGFTTSVTTLRAMKVLATLAFLACAFPLSVPWFFAWRLLSGIAGGAIMVLVAATVLPHVPNERKGLASGAVFLGVGAGIAASGTIVPLLLQFGLRGTWIGLAILCAILTLASWNGWPGSKAPAIAAAEIARALSSTPGARRGLRLLYGEYALVALGIVSPMVFLVDFVARGLGAGAAVGALFWILYGVGALIGPPVYGLLADRFKARNAVRLLLLAQAVAVAVLATAQELPVLALAAIVIGSLPAGGVPLFLAWLREAVPGDTRRENAAWSRATIVFATFQAAGGYGYSAIFNGSGGDYRLVFAIAAAAVLVALVADLALRRRADRKIAPHAG